MDRLCHPDPDDLAICNCNAVATLLTEFGLPEGRAKASRSRRLHPSAFVSKPIAAARTIVGHREAAVVRKCFATVVADSCCQHHAADHDRQNRRHKAEEQAHVFDSNRREQNEDAHHEPGHARPDGQQAAFDSCRCWQLTQQRKAQEKAHRNFGHHGIHSATPAFHQP